MEGVAVTAKDSGQLANLGLHASRRVPGHVFPLDREELRTVEDAPQRVRI